MEDNGLPRGPRKPKMHWTNQLAILIVGFLLLVVLFNNNPKTRDKVDPGYFNEAGELLDKLAE